MAYRPVSVLEVLAWGHTVGAVAPSTRGEGYVFEYDPAWVRRGIELSPTLLPTSGRSRIVDAGTAREGAFAGLPPMLADSLPDRFGNALINAYLAREGVRPETIGPLDRLAYIGNRGMGALTYRPVIGPAEAEPTPIILSEMVTAARAAIRGDLDEKSAAAGTLNQILAIGTSAGGARAKAVVAWNRRTQELQAGSIDVPDEFDPWIIKFDGVDETQQLSDSLQFGRIEYAYSNMARAAGIRMPETHLLVEGGRAHFMVRRFDRPEPGVRWHMQSLCAIEGLDFNLRGVHEYAQYLLAIDSLGLGEADRREGFRRMVFNVLACNNDDHTKNFSFLMDPGGEWSLAPAYDMTFASDPNNVWLRSHLMGVEGEFDDIGRAELERFADRFAIGDAAGVIEQVEDAVADWPRYARDAQLASEQTAHIARAFEDVRLAPRPGPRRGRKFP